MTPSDCDPSTAYYRWLHGTPSSFSRIRSGARSLVQRSFSPITGVSAMGWCEPFSYLPESNCNGAPCTKLFDPLRPVLQSCDHFLGVVLVERSDRAVDAVIAEDAPAMPIGGAAKIAHK